MLIPGKDGHIRLGNVACPGYVPSTRAADTVPLPLLVTPRWVSLLFLPLYFLRAFPSFFLFLLHLSKGIG
jgi:hypothetical protein